MKHKTRIGLSGIVGLGGAVAIAVGTGGAALPLFLISATGIAMKKIASDPDYEPTYKADFSVSNISRNIGCSSTRILDADNKRRYYNAELTQGADLVKQQLANFSQEEYENVSRINIFPEARRKILGLRMGRKSMEVGIEYE